MTNENCKVIIVTHILEIFLDLLKRPRSLNRLNREWNEVMPVLADYQDNENRNNISARIHEYYFQKRSAGADTFAELTQFYSDTTMYKSMHEALYLQTTKSNSPVYAYYYTYQGDSGLSNILQRMLGGLPRILDFLIGTSRRWFEGKLNSNSIQNHGKKISDCVLIISSANENKQIR